MLHLKELAIADSDRFLDLTDLLKALVGQGRMQQDTAEQVSALRRSAVGETQSLHPLEFIASQKLDDLARPGKKLDLETLSRWLAAEAGQPFYRIDPLKINVAEVTPLMSFAFAQRHRILAVEVNERQVTVASAQPLVTSWEANLTHVLKRDIVRVVASPAEAR